MTKDELEALKKHSRVSIVNHRNKSWYVWRSDRAQKANIEPLANRRTAIQSAENDPRRIIVILPEDIELPLEG